MSTGYKILITKNELSDLLYSLKQCGYANVNLDNPPVSQYAIVYIETKQNDDNFNKLFDIVKDSLERNREEVTAVDRFIHMPLFFSIQ